MTAPHEVHVVTVEVDASVPANLRDGLPVASLQQVLERLLHAEHAALGSGVTLLLAGDALLRRLNREHRGLDEPTDVLSFGAGEGEAVPQPVPGAGDEAVTEEALYLGDIALSVEAARRQAAEAGLTTDEELAHLAVHGLLHLLGHDHATPEESAAMRAREEALLGPAIHAAGGDPLH